MRRIASWMLALATLAGSVQASEGRITIGEVSSQVVRSGVNYERLVRAASEQELSSLDLRRVPESRRVIVSVSLVQLETLAERHTTDATCKVSATLRNASTGAIFAILDGSARASSNEAVLAVETSAVHGALHGALARIPEALRR